MYDAKAGRKLTENFYFDINDDKCRNGLCCTTPATESNGEKSNGLNGTTSNGTNAASTSSHNIEIANVSREWHMYPRKAIVSITVPHPDIFLVVKIDKILEGGIQTSTEPYLKATKDPKLAMKLHKHIKLYNQKIGHFRMPFAWAARPLFRLYSNDLDTSIEFPAIYRQEANKLKDEELLKFLAEYRKPDKFSKLTVIPGWLKISIEPITELPNNCLTTTLMPLKQFPIPPVAEPTFEIAEFSGTSERDVHPYTTFINHLYIYPLTLNFDSQKLFSRARNIAILIELKDSDADGAKPIPVNISFRKKNTHFFNN